MSGNPFDTDPWEVAKNRYLSDLTDGEKRAFESATVENLFYSASAAQKLHQDSSKSRAAARKLRPVVNAIQNYGKAIDIFSAVSPLVLSPLWGSIRVLLIIASDFDKYFDKLIDMFEKIGEVLPRLQVYTRLFPNHQRLLDKISGAYLGIINFCMEAKQVFKTGQIETIELSWWGSIRVKSFRKFWSPFSQRFDDILSELQAYRNAVADEVGHAHIVEEADFRAIVRARGGAVELSAAEDIRRRLFRMLSTVDHRNKHNNLAAKRHPSTANWILDTDEHNNWYYGAASSYLWCYGIPGSGKSIVTTRVVDMLLSDPQIPVAYFYCDYGESASLEAIQILGSFVKQLLYRFEIPAVIKGLIQQAYTYDGADERKPVIEEVETILRTTFGLFAGHTIYFVLDGLDECPLPERSKILPILRNIVDFNDQVVKIFVSTREEVDTMQQLKDFPSICISDRRNTSDITRFVKDTVEQRQKESILTISDPKLMHEIMNALIDGARGMFLWVTLQLDEICEALDESRIRELLLELPEDLAETYRRILRKIVGHHERESVACRALRWLVCAKRPLSVEELKEAVAFQRTDRFWDASKIPTDGLKLIRACGNLVTLDEDGKTLRLIHYTVHEFLVSEPKDASLEKFHFSFSDADREVGEICVSYLSFSDFETQIIRQLPDYRLDAMRTLQSAVDDQISHPDGITEVAAVMCRSMHWLTHSHNERQRKPDINFTDYLPPKKTLPPLLETKYRLLDYITEYWLWHTTEFTPNNTEVWPLLRHLVLENQMAFDFNHCENLGPSDRPYQSLFVWAARSNHTALLKLLFEPPSGPDVHSYAGMCKMWPGEILHHSPHVVPRVLHGQHADSDDIFQLRGRLITGIDKVIVYYDTTIKAIQFHYRPNDIIHPLHGMNHGFCQQQSFDLLPNEYITRVIGHGDDYHIKQMQFFTNTGRQSELCGLPALEGKLFDWQCSSIAYGLIGFASVWRPSFLSQLRPYFLKYQWDGVDENPDLDFSWQRG